MSDEPSGEDAEFPRTDDTRSREETDNRPHYLGDKVDAAVERMEEEGTPMSDKAERLLQQGKEALDDIVGAPDMER
ncbi:MAG: hypothetical protein ACRDIB_11900 [Ardenticatenaceae bacterium]